MSMKKIREVFVRELLETLREVSEELRDRKWEIVRTLKGAGHDFTATSEGMDVVLSAPPSMRF